MTVEIGTARAGPTGARGRVRAGTDTGTTDGCNQSRDAKPEPEHPTRAAPRPWRDPWRYCCHVGTSNSVQNVPGVSVLLEPTSFAPPSRASSEKTTAAASRSAAVKPRGIPAR